MDMNIKDLCVANPHVVATLSGTALLIGLLVLGWGYNHRKKFRYLKDTPLVKIKNITKGLISVYGKICLLPDQKGLKSPFTRESCVYYSYIIRKQKLEKSNDTDVADKYVWETGDKGDQSIHFFIEDDTGKILVNIKGAEVDGTPEIIALWKDARVRNGLLSEEGMPSINGKPIDPKFRTLFSKSKDIKEWSLSEFYLPEPGYLYVLGFAENIDGSGDMKINESTYVSKRNREQILKSFSFMSQLGYISGSFLAVTSLLILIWALRLIY